MLALVISRWDSRTLHPPCLSLVTVWKSASAIRCKRLTMRPHGIACLLQLSTAGDLNYMKDKFLLSQSDEEAADAFRRLIHQVRALPSCATAQSVAGGIFVEH